MAADVLCWRCMRKLFRIKIPAGAEFPVGVVIEQPCSRCRAMNSIPLDKLTGRVVALG